MFAWIYIRRCKSSKFSNTIFMYHLNVRANSFLTFNMQQHPSHIASNTHHNENTYTPRVRATNVMYIFSNYFLGR